MLDIILKDKPVSFRAEEILDQSGTCRGGALRRKDRMTSVASSTSGQWHSWTLRAARLEHLVKHLVSTLDGSQF